MAGGGLSMQYTPTWAVAVVCTVIVAISILVERLLHRAGKYLLKKDQKPLYQALNKIKEELMLLGFISFLLTISQHGLNKICIPKHLYKTWLPCNREPHSASSTAHFATFLLPEDLRRHLARKSTEGYCEEQHKTPLMSLKAVHHLHILIFVLAVSHVVFCALTILFGGAKIRQWRVWEDEVHNAQNQLEDEAPETRFTHVRDHDFVRKRFVGSGKRSSVLGWFQSFFKQFYGSVTKSDYTTLRFGFIMTHCPGNQNFDFHKYMTRAFESDFKKVVGISWYLWMFVVLFLLLNVHGWYAYFWISFIPVIIVFQWYMFICADWIWYAHFQLLVTVGAKLEHVIMELAREVAEKHVAVEGDLVVRPSDDHFWFRRPKIVLLVIHIILFQNAFEIAVFFWTWVQYGLDSCIMGKLKFVIPRLVIGAFVQFTCSYSTLPLYALVTQMGSKIKLGAFDQPIQQGLVGWAQKAKKNLGQRKAANGSTQDSSVKTKTSDIEEGKATH